MAATGLEVFDKTLQTTNIWLDEIMAELVPDRKIAWHALGAVLRALRDRMTVEQAAHLGAQLPLLIRGLYYDQWHPAGKPDKERKQEEFLERIMQDLSQTRPIDPKDAARVVLEVMSRHVTEGQMEKVKLAMPQQIRALFPGEYGPEQGESSASAERT